MGELEKKLENEQQTDRLRGPESRRVAWVVHDRMVGETTGIEQFAGFFVFSENQGNRP
jgi:hypothetical protein